MTHKLFTPDEQQLLAEIMLHRRDVRGNRFLPDPIDDAVIDTILQAAAMAPSVGFSQPWEFVMVRDSHIKQQVAQSFAIENQKAAHVFDDEKHALYSQLKLEGILEAPLNIAVFYKPSTNAVLGQNSMAETGEYSVVCAIQNMWLMARALNVGLGWVSIINPQTVKTILHAPADNKLVAYLCLGYVDEFYDQPELEKRQWEKRKQIESVVYQDRY